MKRDFSQPFIKADPTRVYILAEDADTGNFLLLRSADDDKESNGFYSEEYHAVPHVDLNESAAIDVVTEAAKVLYSYGLLLSSMRELARITAVSYSFVDDTQGVKADEACIHVVVDQTRNVVEGEGRNIFVPLDQVGSLLKESSSLSRSLVIGVAKLALEREFAAA